MHKTQKSAKNNIDALLRNDGKVELNESGVYIAQRDNIKGIDVDSTFVKDSTGWYPFLKSTLEDRSSALKSMFELNDGFYIRIIKALEDDKLYKPN